MTTAAIRCVVFDVDDTLYLERDYVRSGFDSVGAWLQRDSGVVGFSDRLGG
jgi:putative hydrolase of the HAD superfamily